MLKFDIHDDHWHWLTELGVPDHAYRVEPSSISWNWDCIVVEDPQWVTWFLLRQDHLPWIIERI